MTTNDIDAIRQLWLNPCGPCDAGLPALCGHPDADERPVIAALCDEVEQLRAVLAEILAVAERFDTPRDSSRVRVFLGDLKHIAGRAITGQQDNLSGVAR